MLTITLPVIIRDRVTAGMLFTPTKSCLSKRFAALLDFAFSAACSPYFSDCSLLHNSSHGSRVLLTLHHARLRSTDATCLSARLTTADGLVYHHPVESVTHGPSRPALLDVAA